MIDDLRALAIFVKVAETGSFTAAGRELRLSTSVVSHHVKGLETRHGVSLLHRSTRALSLTGEGQKLLESASLMVEAAAAGLNAIADNSDDPTGSLRITIPAFLANSPKENAIWQFVGRYSNVSLTVDSRDDLVNLVADGFDLAIRLGNLSDSGLFSRKIGTFERCLVAAPSYLESAKMPVVPGDLAECTFVLLDMLPNKISLRRGNDEVTIQPERYNLVVNSVASARSALLAGLGIQRLPYSEVADDIAAGRLVRVLPDWSLATLNIYAVWATTKRPGSLVGLLLDYLAADG